VKPKKTGGRANRPPVHSIQGFAGPEKPTGFVLSNPKGFYLLVERPTIGGGPPVKEFVKALEPSPIEDHLVNYTDTDGGLKSCDLFLHRSIHDKDRWDVSNGLTGLRVSTEPKRNKGEAAHDAVERVHTKGSQSFWDAVNSHLQMSGATPRYRRET
jgi:hypothetical protein